MGQRSLQNALVDIKLRACGAGLLEVAADPRTRNIVERIFQAASDCDGSAMLVEIDQLNRFHSFYAVDGNSATYSIPEGEMMRLPFDLSQDEAEDMDRFFDGAILGTLLTPLDDTAQDYSSVRVYTTYAKNVMSTAFELWGRTSVSEGDQVERFQEFIVRAAMGRVSAMSRSLRFRDLIDDFAWFTQLTMEELLALKAGRTWPRRYLPSQDPELSQLSEEQQIDVLYGERWSDIERPGSVWQIVCPEPEMLCEASLTHVPRLQADFASALIQHWSADFRRAIEQYERVWQCYTLRLLRACADDQCRKEARDLLFSKHRPSELQLLIERAEFDDFAYATMFDRFEEPIPGCGAYLFWDGRLLTASTTWDCAILGPSGIDPARELMSWNSWRIPCRRDGDHLIYDGKSAEAWLVFDGQRAVCVLDLYILRTPEISPLAEPTMLLRELGVRGSLHLCPDKSIIPRPREAL